jgi:hypothetical protein
VHLSTLSRSPSPAWTTRSCLSVCLEAAAAAISDKAKERQVERYFANAIKSIIPPSSWSDGTADSPCCSNAFSDRVVARQMNASRQMKDSLLSAAANKVHFKLATFGTRDGLCKTAQSRGNISLGELLLVYRVTLLAAAVSQVELVS